ncbi:nuclear transport factor 2 family protein [Algibacillus agarilyticus]|uniref:nuclear transport factor 2 family protein n=1 Tax=Algibacillus agarilyticus TaxID=2234133 RepID=UPI000DD0C722|nr:nuclear transport factor 2 family protein [Algibacillus agarilyticus]
MEPAFDAVCKLLKTYFDGLYYADVKRLNQVFHPRSHYVCATRTDVILWTLPEYLYAVAQRVSPASLHAPRYDHILSIDFAGPNTALAKVSCTIQPKHFTDLLSLIKTDGQWQIISKNFHFTIEE